MSVFWIAEVVQSKKLAGGNEMKKIIVCVLSIIAVSATALAQSQKPIFNFDQLFPRSKQHQMGLHKLTTKEKEALRSHVEKRLIFAVTAKSGNPAGGGVYAGVGGGHWIQKNIDSGTYIILEDGSLWEVDPLDRIDASLWLLTSEITVRESSSGTPGYDYLLINTDDAEMVHAKYRGNK